MTDGQLAIDRDQRDSVFLHAMISAVDGSALGRFRIRNVSQTGLMAQGPITWGHGSLVKVDLRNIGCITGRVVWTKEGSFGMSFDTTIDPKLARQPVGRAVS